MKRHKKLCNQSGRLQEPQFTSGKGEKANLAPTSRVWHFMIRSLLYNLITRLKLLINFKVLIASMGRIRLDQKTEGPIYQCKYRVRRAISE